MVVLLLWVLLVLALDRTHALESICAGIFSVIALPFKLIVALFKGIEYLFIQPVMQSPAARDKAAAEAANKKALLLAEQLLEANSNLKNATDRMNKAKEALASLPDIPWTTGAMRSEDIAARSLSQYNKRKDLEYAYREAIAHRSNQYTRFLTAQQAYDAFIKDIPPQEASEVQSLPASVSKDMIQSWSYRFGRLVKKFIKACAYTVPE